MLQEFQGTPGDRAAAIIAGLRGRKASAHGAFDSLMVRIGHSAGQDLPLDPDAIASAHEAVKSVAGLFTQGETLAASTTSGERFPVAHAECAPLPPSSPAADKPPVKSKA